MKLDCENPTLMSWLSQLERLRQATCTVLGVRCDKRFVLQDSCQQWTPMAIVATAGVCFIVVLCFTVIAATSVAENLLRWAARPVHRCAPLLPACSPWVEVSSVPCAPLCQDSYLPGAGGGSGPAAAALRTRSGPPRQRARSCAGRTPSATRPRRTPGTSCAARARRRRSSARPCSARTALRALTPRARCGGAPALHALGFTLCRGESLVDAACLISCCPKGMQPQALPWTSTQPLSRPHIHKGGCLDAASSSHANPRAGGLRGSGGVWRVQSAEGAVLRGVRRGRARGRLRAQGGAGLPAGGGGRAGAGSPVAARGDHLLRQRGAAQYGPLRLAVTCMHDSTPESASRLADGVPLGG
jgi:hypothetical protein